MTRFYSSFFFSFFLLASANLSFAQCPNGTVSTLPYVEDFEDNSAPFIGLSSSSESIALLTGGAGNASNIGIVLEGGNGSGFSLPSASTVWTTNTNSMALASFCVDLTGATQATFNFDLKQGYFQEDFNTNLRLLINGVQVGSDYRPAGATTNWNTYSINLTSYVGSVVTISLQSSVKYSRAQGFNTYNFIDNILVSTADITAPVITNITVAPNSCSAVSRSISANITDNSGIVTTRQVKWKKCLNSTWNTITMNFVSGTTFTSVSPISATTGTIDYYIVAIDPSGNTKTSETYTYSNGEVGLGSYEDFESQCANLWTYIKNTESNAEVNADAAFDGSNGLMLTGKSGTTWTGANWSPADPHFSSGKFCVDLSSASTATLQFNLFQGYQFDASYTNFRITVNGTQVGSIYNPRVNNTEWDTITMDLTSFIAQGMVTITFESSVKNDNLTGSTTYNYIDNVLITDADIYLPVITNVSEAANICTVSSRTITANVTDNDAVDIVDIVYSNDNGANWTSTAMSLVSGSTYSGTIPAIAGTVIYRIAASDLSSNTDTSIAKTYVSGSLSFPYSQTFESGVAPYWDLENRSRSVVAIDSLAGNSSVMGLLMSGNGVPGFVTPNASNVWNINTAYYSKATFCVDLSSASSAFITFDLQQGFNGNAFNTNLKVSVNGQQVGSDFRPNNFTVPFQTYSFNLSAYAGMMVPVTFESSVKYSAEADSTNRAYNFIDNININTTSTSSDVFPPDISNITIPTNSCSNGSRTIMATIEDSSGVTSPKLYYRSNYGAWQNVVMTHITTTSNYTAVIPTLSGSIDYYVSAGDNVGNTGTSRIFTYGSGTATSPYSANFESSFAPFFGFLDNLGSSVKLDSSAGNSSNIGIVLEGGNGAGYVTPNASTVWLSNPDNLGKASFCVNLSGLANPLLSFDLNQGFDADNFNTNLRVLVNGNQLAEYRPSGAATGWKTDSVDLTGYSGVVTITFESMVKYNRTLGTSYNYLDNINVSNNNLVSVKDLSNASLNEPLIYPNPSSGLINISTNNKPAKITIYNNLGQVVYSKTIANSLYTFDLSNETTGLYFISIEQEGHHYMKKVNIIK